MKKTIIAFILGGIIFSSITATAAYVYTARDIGYQPTDTEWNVSNVQDAINEIKTDVNNINDLVDQGDMLYPVGTNIVGLVSDDTPYKDSNGKYILADSTTGKNMIDNDTYKSISSTETLKGKVGSDSVDEFKTSSYTIDPNKDYIVFLATSTAALSNTYSSIARVINGTVYYDNHGQQNNITLNDNLLTISTAQLEDGRWYHIVYIYEID